VPIDCVVREVPRIPPSDEQPASTVTPSTTETSVADDFCMLSPVTYF
jgi:hypothetical protein